jgi:hypothetical protein
MSTIFAKLNDSFDSRGYYMSKQLIAPVLFVLVLLICAAPAVHAQAERDVREKQGELKREFNDAQEKNQIIRSAALDKPRATTGRRRASVTTGYDYTQIKGFALRQFYDRIDKVFESANELGLFDEEYRADGTFDVPGRSGKGSAQMRKVDVFYVEATPQEQERYGVEPFQIIEVYVEKLEMLPPEDMGVEDVDGEGGLGEFGMSVSEPVAKGFSIAGTDLLSVLQLADEALYDDILSRRSMSMSIPLPERGDWMPGKVGPFIVMTQRELETTTSRFSDFWNSRDTLAGAVQVPQYDAAGPFYELQTPIFYPDFRRIRIRNPENRPVKITNIQFVGANADKFEVRTKFPIQLTERGGAQDRTDIEFNLLEETPYEIRGMMVIDAREAGLNQVIEVYANPGIYPSDIFTLDASLDRIEVRSPARSSIAPNWKLTYNIGNDEIGLPRWSTGISSLSIGFKNQMSVGIVLPMNMTAPDLPDPLAFQKGLLSSPSGYHATFDFTFGFPFSLGGHLYVINDFDGEKAYNNMNVLTQRPQRLDEEDYFGDFFHIGTIAQVYYPIMFKDKAFNPNVAFRLNIGGGYLNVRRNHLVSAADIGNTKLDRTFTTEDVGRMITLGKQKDYFDVYVRMSFINLSSTNRYGLGIQYFSGRMMTDAFLELTSWLRVDAKYSFLLRSREVWESENTYFLITPRFRIGIPSIFN